MPDSPRYRTILKLASGGMATVWVGAVNGAMGFRQLVAIKKPHAHLVERPEFVNELMKEARLASMIHHANVVDVRDVVQEDGELGLVMDYIEGASLADLLREAKKRKEHLPARAVVRIILDACAGLHAAHELPDERGRLLNLIHRDVSPHNILVGTDGIARVADFGIAKLAHGDSYSTEQGALKGKLPYLSPEYLAGSKIDRRTDIYALSIVMWEALTGEFCFQGEHEAETLSRILKHVPRPVSKMVPDLGPSFDAVIAMGLAKGPNDRFATAAAFANAIEAEALRANMLGSSTDVASLVEKLFGPSIEVRRETLRNSLAASPSLASLIPGPREREDTDKSAAPQNMGQVPPPEGSSHSAVILRPETLQPRPLLLPLVLVALVLVGASSLLTAVMLRKSQPTEATTKVAEPAPPEVAEPEAAPSATTTPSRTATATTTAPPPVAPATAVVRKDPPVQQKKPVLAPADTASAKRAHCNPPYTTDEEGVRHLKRECL